MCLVAVSFGFAIACSLSRVEGLLAWRGRGGSGVVGAGAGCWEFTIEWERERVVGFWDSPDSLRLEGA